jgi:hypothetical protein
VSSSASARCPFVFKSPASLLHASSLCLLSSPPLDWFVIAETAAHSPRHDGDGGRACSTSDRGRSSGKAEATRPLPPSSLLRVGLKGRACPSSPLPLSAEFHSTQLHSALHCAAHVQSAPHTHHDEQRIHSKRFLFTCSCAPCAVSFPCRLPRCVLCPPPLLTGGDWTAAASTSESKGSSGQTAANGSGKTWKETTIQTVHEPLRREEMSPLKTNRSSRRAAAVISLCPPPLVPCAVLCCAVLPVRPRGCVLHPCCDVTWCAQRCRVVSCRAVLCVACCVVKG